MAAEPQNDDWLEVEVDVGPGDAAEVAGALTTSVDHARAGVELRPGGIVFWVRAAEGEAAVRDTRAALAALARGGMAAGPARVRLRPAQPESEWRDAWKRHFGVTRVSSRIVVVPSWEAYVARPDDVVLDLDPGRAFGTGAHASTRLCLAELDAMSLGGRAGAREVRRFLDVGTGSGILAIAAAKLWPAASGVAIDVDPEAVAAASENRDRNGVGDRLVCAAAPVAAIVGRFDLVTANIQADVLEPLREAIISRTAPGGTVILSGLLSGEAEGVGAVYAALPGCRLVGLRRLADDPEWSCVVIERVAPA